MDNGVGWIDCEGDHRYCENFSLDKKDGDDEWIAELRTIRDGEFPGSGGHVGIGG